MAQAEKQPASDVRMITVGICIPMQCGGVVDILVTPLAPR